MFKVNQKVWCAIYGAGVVVEVQHASGGAYPVEIVRAKVKPSIDWSHVSPEYNYLAQDKNGDGYLCGEEPSRHTSAWDMESPYLSATTFTSYEPGTCDWKVSLVKRPD